MKIRTCAHSSLIVREQKTLKETGVLYTFSASLLLTANPAVLSGYIHCAPEVDGPSHTWLEHFLTWLLEMNAKRTEMRGIYYSFWENFQNIWIIIMKGQRQWCCPFVIHGERQIVVDKFIKGAILWFYGMTLGKKVRLSTSIIKRTRKENILELFSLAVYIY